MKPGYEPKTIGGMLSWIEEEAAEASQAISKTLRFQSEKGIGIIAALHLYNPDVSALDRETNHAWILREIADLKAAIALFEAKSIPCISGLHACGFNPDHTFTCYRCKRLRCFCQGAGGHEDCTSCWAKRKKIRDNKKSPRKTKARSSRTKERRAAAGAKAQE